MSLIQLRSFVEVYRRRSLTEAARALTLTQPAISQHIQSLETQLGRPLFARHARGVAPTAIADELAATLGTRLDEAEGAFAAMRARSQQMSGTVHIAGPAEYLAERFSDRIAMLTDAGLSVRLHIGGRDAIYAMLGNDMVDLALTASTPSDDRLDHRVIDKERLLLVTSPALAERIGTADEGLAECLAHFPCVAYDMERPLIREWAKMNGAGALHAPLAASVPDLRMLRSLVQRNIGWSVLPDYLCESQIQTGTLLVLGKDSPTAENPLQLVWNRGALRHPRVTFARQLLLAGETAMRPSTDASIPSLA